MYPGRSRVRNVGGVTFGFPLSAQFVLIRHPWFSISHVISAVNIAGRSPSFYLSIRTHTLCVLTHHTAGVVSVTACVTDRDRRK